MALTKCRECGEQVSNKAGTCPKCGCPTKGKNKSAGRLLFLLILIGLGFVIYRGIRPELESARDRGTQERQQRERETKWDAETLNQPDTTNRLTAEPQKITIELLRLYMTSTRHAAADVRLTNTSDVPLKVVFVSISCYDEQGRYLVKGIASASLPAGQSRVAEATFLDTHIRDIKRWDAQLDAVMREDGRTVTLEFRLTQERQPDELEETDREAGLDVKWEAEALKQPQRQLFIQDNMGTFGIRKIEPIQNGATLWITGNFYLLDFDGKQTICHLIYSYYATEFRDENYIVRLRDNNTGKEIGIYSKLGLRMK